MRNATCSPTRRQRKPLVPVQVTGRFGSLTADLQALRLGTAVLFLTDLTTGEETLYWAKGVSEGGILAGIVLEKLDGGKHPDGYMVRLKGENAPACDCPDACYRPDRPGGCKHLAAVRQAVATLAADLRRRTGGLQPAPAA